MRKKTTHIILKDITLSAILDDQLLFDKITKDDYELFIYELMKALTLNWNNESAILPADKYTKFFGTYTNEEGKQMRKFSKIKQNLVDAGLINITNYCFDIQHPENSYASEIFLTQKFRDIYAQKQIKFGMNDISDKLYKKMFKTKNIPLETSTSRSHYDLLMSDRVSFDVETYAKNITKTELLKNWRVSSFFNKDIFTMTDEKTGRVYSSFTSLGKAARPHVTIDGQHLENIDLKSAQPLLFVYYLKQIGVETKELETLLDIIIKDDVYYWFLNKYIAMFGSNEYTEFDKKTNSFVKKTIENREDAKVQMFRVLYKSNRGDKPPFEKVMQVEFPILYGEMKNVKRGLTKLNTNLAVKMQKLEADIFIPVANKYTELGCLSLHDALYFKPELGDDIKKDLKDALLENGIPLFELK